MLKLQDKKKTVDELTDIIKRANVVAVFGIRGMPTRRLQTLRRKVKSNQGFFRVSKRSLIWRAADSAKMPIAMDPKEPVAMVAAFEEEMTALKALPKGEMPFLFGIFNGKIITREEVAYLQTLPGRQALRGQLTRDLKTLLWKFVTILKMPEVRMHSDLTQRSKHLSQ